MQARLLHPQKEEVIALEEMVLCWVKFDVSFFYALLCHVLCERTTGGLYFLCY